jgi:predicted ester cyclase
VYYFDNGELHIYRAYCLGINYRDIALVGELVEGLTMMGTVITGVLGTKACCIGLGRLLTRLDQDVQQRQA